MDNCLLAVVRTLLPDFWGNGNNIMDNFPEDAWRFLSQAPGPFQSKMLVQDL